MHLIELFIRTMNRKAIVGNCGFFQCYPQSTIPSTGSSQPSSFSLKLLPTDPTLRGKSMKSQTVTVIITTLLVCSLACAQNRSQPPLATPAELQQMFDAKQYNICLQQIARILRAPASATTAHDP